MARTIYPATHPVAPQTGARPRQFSLGRFQPPETLTGTVSLRPPYADFGPQGIRRSIKLKSPPTPDPTWTPPASELIVH